MQPALQSLDELGPSGVLTPTEFNAAADLWLSSRAAGGAELTNCLLTPGTSTRLPAVYFSVQQLVELVSVVGVQSIRARFVVLRDGPQLRFSVALYAAGAADAVLSSYYLAERYWAVKAAYPVAEAGAPRTKAGRTGSRHALPPALAAYWQANWNGNSDRYPTSPALFTSAGQPLQGYNFALDDLLDPLRGLSAFEGQMLALNFGLHTFSNFNGKVDAPVATFGLLLQLANTSARDEDGAGDEVYDIAVPCPPGH